MLFKWIRRVVTGWRSRGLPPQCQPRDFYDRAVLCLERCDTAGAIVELQRAIAQFPGYVPGYVRLADLLDRVDRWSEAETIATAGLERNPNASQQRKLLCTRGAARVQQGDWVGGSADLHAAIAAGQPAKVIYDTANRFSQRQEFDRAIGFLEHNRSRLCDGNDNLLRFWRPLRGFEASRELWNADRRRVQQHRDWELHTLRKQPMFELAALPASQFPPAPSTPVHARYEFPAQHPAPLPLNPDTLDGLLEPEWRSLLAEGSLPPELCREHSQTIVTLPDAIVGCVGETRQFVFSQRGFYYGRDKRLGLGAIGYAIAHPVRRTLAQAYFLGLAATDNYYHRLMDVISSLVQYPLEQLDCPLLVFADQLELTRRLVAGAGIDRDRVQPIAPEQGLLVQTGFIATGELDLDGRIGTLGRRIAAHILQTAAIAPGVAERVYISRRRAARRPLENEPAIETMLQAQGFQVVHMEDEPFERQVAIVCGAQVLVASHGAGLVNALFAPIGLTIIELLPAAYPLPAYCKLSHLCGHRYYPLLGATSPAADLSQEETFRWSIDGDRLQAVLDRVL